MVNVCATPLVDTPRIHALKSRPMHTILRATAVTLLAGTLGLAGTDATSAQQILANAQAEAAAQHKIIFVLFEATW